MYRICKGQANFAPEDAGQGLYIMKYREAADQVARQDVALLSSIDRGFPYANYVAQSNGVKTTWSSENRRVKQRPALYTLRQK